VIYIDGKKQVSYLEDLQLGLNDAKSLPGKYGYYYNTYRWHNLVRVYSKPSLTELTDRIVGISGLASRFGEILCDEYVAGLWKSYLPVELLCIADAKKANLVERPKDYQGPSWSWVAVNNGIRQSLSCDPFTGVGRCFKVIDSYIQLSAKGARFATGDPGFGAVGSAELVVTSRLRKAKWVNSDSEPLPRRTVFLSIFNISMRSY
jgi:hypothetical protein